MKTVTNMTPALTTPTPPVDNLTPTQAHVLRYMRAHFAQEHELPSCLDIADAFGYASPNAANEMQHRLEALGMLERNTHGRLKFTQRGLLGEIVEGKGQ